MIGIELAPSRWLCYWLYKLPPTSGSFENFIFALLFTLHPFCLSLYKYLTCSDRSNTPGEDFQSQHGTSFGQLQTLVRRRASIVVLLPCLSVIGRALRPAFYYDE